MSNETEMTIVGNLTADPEKRTTGNGMSVCNLTIASTPRTYNRNTNQWEDGQALFMRCTAWRALADNIAATLSKGMRVIAQGRLSQQSYQAQDGSSRTSLVLTLDAIGPDLSHASAQVMKNQQPQTGQSNGFAGWGA